MENVEKSQNLVNTESSENRMGSFSTFTSCTEPKPTDPMAYTEPKKTKREYVKPDTRGMFTGVLEAEDEAVGRIFAEIDELLYKGDSSEAKRKFAKFTRFTCDDSLVTLRNHHIIGVKEAVRRAKVLSEMNRESAHFWVDISDVDSLKTIIVGVAEGTAKMTLEDWIKDFVQKRPSMALLDVKTYTKKLETETDPAMRAEYAKRIENAKLTAEHCQDLLTQWEALGDMKARLTRTKACVLKIPTDLYVNKPAKLVEWVRTARKTNFVWDITIGTSVE